MKDLNILTVDLEDWFHICGVEDLLPEESWGRLESRVEKNTRVILSILDRHGVKATFFVLGFVAEGHPELIRDIARRGHEIATHGYAHRRVYEMSPKAFREDLRKARAIIEEITGARILGYRAPEWSIRDDSIWAPGILEEEGFLYDSSMAPLPIIGNKAYPRVPHRAPGGAGVLWEFPPLVAPAPLTPLPLGGGWGLRVFPYRVIRHAVTALNRAGHPALFYVHPREFDRRNPKVSLPLSRRFVLNARVARTGQRLCRLLEDFRFTTVARYLESSIA
ncbi:MAG: polysaccharide deacetylase family protein [Deltaproteobacteria bacterium]|nr:polysaccharide deacetylase family protein [Deltaproteobacteria bacterium]